MQDLHQQLLLKGRLYGAPYASSVTLIDRKTSSAKSLRTKALQAPTVGRLWAALDRRLACDTCSFAASNEGEVTLHYGIEHGGLNFFRQEVLNRQSLGGMLVSGEDLLSTRVADGNCKPSGVLTIHSKSLKCSARPPSTTSACQMASRIATFVGSGFPQNT